MNNGSTGAPSANIKKMISQLSVNVFLPLLACILSIFIKFLYFGCFNFEVLDPTEISFSFAMYLLLCIIGVKNLPDKDLANSLFLPYIIVVLMLFAMFVLSIFLKTQQETVISQAIRSQTSATAKLLENPVLDRIRIATIVMSTLSTVISEIARKKYKIEV